MNPWYLVIALCLVDGFLCHELMETWDAKGKQPPNTPLTIDELRELDGEPVYLDLGDGGEWALVRLREDGIYFSHKNSICAPATIAFSCGGRVYRRKPKEGK